MTGVDGAAVVAFAVGEDDWELADVAEHAVVEVERGNQELKNDHSVTELGM